MAIGELNRSFALLSEVRTQLSNVRDCNVRAELALDRHEREVSTCAERLLHAIDGSDES